MFKGYKPEEHNVADNQAVLISFQLESGTGKIDLKIGKQLRRVLNNCIEEEGRRKKYFYAVRNDSKARIILQGSRYLIMSDFNDKVKEKEVDEAVLDQMFSNNGSTLSFYLANYEPQYVEGTIKDIVEIVKCALEYAMECDLPALPDTFNIANKVITNKPQQQVTIILTN